MYGKYICVCFQYPNQFYVLNRKQTFHMDHFKKIVLCFESVLISVGETFIILIYKYCTV
jgi:hypothetical protein